jgi:signal transduction histidine kinase
VDSLSPARDGAPVLSRPRWRPDLDASGIRWVLFVAVGYYLAARLGFAFTLRPSPLSTLWPPNALLLASLLLTPSRLWAWLILAALPAHLFAELQGGVPLAMVLGWYVSNCSEALIGAALVRAFLPGPLRLNTLASTATFLLGGVLAAPLLSSFLDAALVSVVGWGNAGYWELLRTRVLSNALAEIVVAPLVLTWGAFHFARLREAPPRRYAEAAALFAGLLAASLVFDLPQLGLHATPAVFYAPLPFLLWAAVRFGPTGTATAIALMALATIWGAVSGLGPFTGQAPAQTARDMQLFLIAVAAPLLLLAAALEERRHIERDAREQRLQLTHLSRVAMLGELSGGIVHELNQPLTAILSNAQAARHFIANNSADPQLLGEILQDIILADQRAGDVIRRLRTLFKRGETNFETLDANALVRDVLRIVNGDLVLRSVRAEIDLGPGLPAVEGDRVELQQVILNLVMNACEAMGGVEERLRRLAIRTQAGKDGGVVISVTDNGLGFRPEQYERLFEPFYTTKRQGLGLGLSICRTIVGAHRGRLWGAATPGEGAAFHVQLPAVKPPPRP